MSDKYFYKVPTLRNIVDQAGHILGVDEIEAASDQEAIEQVLRHYNCGIGNRGKSKDASPTARRIKLVVSCDHCGHECLEPLPRLLRQNGVVCRKCASALDLTSKENRLVFGELVKLCENIDASVSKGRRPSQGQSDSGSTCTK